MSNSSPRPDPPGDEEIGTTFRRLRLDGHSRLEAVRMILDVLDVSLAEAKTLLLTNDTWDEAQSAAESTGDSGEASSGNGEDSFIPPAPG